jgi:hypothetical protein
VLRLRALSKASGEQQFDMLRRAPPPPLAGWRRRQVPDAAQGRREGVEFSLEVTPLGLMLEQTAVSAAGSTLNGEPVWYRFKAEVGEVGKRKRTQFVVDRLLPEGGIMVEVTLPRPLGIVFEPDSQGRVRVAQLLDGFQAQQRASV